MPFPVDGLHARRQIRLQICLQTNWNRLNLNWHPFPWLCGNRPWEMAFQFNLQNCSLGTCNYGNRYGDTTRHDFLASPVRRFCPNDKTIFAQVGWFSEKLGRQQPPPPGPYAYAHQSTFLHAMAGIAIMHESYLKELREICYLMQQSFVFASKFDYSKICTILAIHACSDVIILVQLLDFRQY